MVQLDTAATPKRLHQQLLVREAVDLLFQGRHAALTTGLAFRSFAACCCEVHLKRCLLLFAMHVHCSIVSGPITHQRVYGLTSLQVTAKAAHTEVLKVSNWLNKPQRFKVVVELSQADPATRLTGAAHCPVAAVGKARPRHRLQA